jgi:hypothetical protein
MSTLALDSGAKFATLDELRCVPEPEILGSRHYPLPHDVLRDTVVDSVKERGIEIREERIALSKNGLRYFGLLILDPGSAVSPDWTMALGIRGSLDQSFAASLVGGSQVFVCDNLAFTGEVRVSRKNTMYCRRDLPGRVESGLDRLLGEADRLAARYTTYRETAFMEPAVDRTLMRLVRSGGLPASKIPAILSEFESPSHEEHGRDTAWTFFNAVTETLKGSNAERLVGRTIRLHEAVDTEVALAF